MKWCFGIATAWFSMRRCEPLDRATAAMYLPALQLFYALQYYVLDRHLPVLAPWISFASLAAAGLLYWGARQYLRRPLSAARSCCGATFPWGCPTRPISKRSRTRWIRGAGWVRAREDEAGRRVRLHAT